MAWRPYRCACYFAPVSINYELALITSSTYDTPDDNINFRHIQSTSTASSGLRRLTGRNIRLQGLLATSTAFTTILRAHSQSQCFFLPASRRFFMADHHHHRVYNRDITATFIITAEASNLHHQRLIPMRFPTWSQEVFTLRTLQQSNI
jgi:hypothetical protein